MKDISLMTKEEFDRYGLNPYEDNAKNEEAVRGMPSEEAHSASGYYTADSGKSSFEM